MTGRPLPWRPEEVAALKSQAKKLLRKRLRSLRAQLPDDLRRAKSTEITKRIVVLPAWEKATTVALYFTFGDEFETAALVDAARAAGKAVALPRTAEGHAPMTFHLAYGADGQSYPTEMSAYGVLEPALDNPIVAREAIGFVLVPALAVDDRGFRIGYGRAHYDMTLPTLVHAVRVAAVFEFQRLAEVPEESHDVAVDVLVSERETFTVPHASRADARPESS